MAAGVSGRRAAAVSLWGTPPYAIDLSRFETIADWTLGQFKDWLLNCRPDEAQQVGKALTGVMAAAVAKLCDVHELIFIAKKIKRTTQARTTLGLPGTLSSRLQPNHPTDDPRGITLLVYWGLSLGAGDAVIGLNPAIDTVENVSALLSHLDQIRRHTGAGGDTFASRSMSAYLVYRLCDSAIQKDAAQFSGNSDIRFEYTVISNIYSRGLPGLEAGALIVEKAVEILTAKAAGNRLAMLQSSI